MTVSGVQLPPPRRLPPHLLAALLALGTIVLMIVGGEVAVRIQLRRHINVFAAPMSPAKLSGNILQTAVFRTDGWLPVFGSSELNRPAANRPDGFFGRRPTGFAPFLIGRGGVTCLLITQKIAAAGPAVRGRKVAIFLSPSWFLRPEVSSRTVAGNLAPLQIGSWIFHDDLSLKLRRQLATRLLDYPDALAGQPLITTALRSLDQNSVGDRLQLAALTPFGRMQNFLLERVESYTLLRELFNFERRRLLEQSDLSGAPAPGATINWSRLAEKAEVRDRASGYENSYSVGPPTQEAGQKSRQPDAGKTFPPCKKKPKGEEEAAQLEEDRAEAVTGERAVERDADFYTKLAASKEWTDLQLLLATLKELGADAIFINQPFNGVYRDLGGNSAQARRVYYEKLHAFIDPTGFPLFDFSEHEEDKYFFNDSGHPSGKAWIYYDHVLSDFYAHRNQD